MEGLRIGTRRPPTAWLAVSAILAAVLAVAAPQAAASTGRSSFSLGTAAARGGGDHTSAVARYWTPQRMIAARPLGAILRRLGEPGGRAAGSGRSKHRHKIDFTNVADPTQPPYRVSGRIFLRIGRYNGYCSGTAIDSPSRQLVLTAGHCLYDLLPRHRIPTESRYFDFVPAYTHGEAPFGEFIGKKGYLLRPWLRRLNENFDMAAVITKPNSAGLKVADAVGGGARIVLDKTRKQRYQLLGYPGVDQQQMKECSASFLGNDKRTYRLGGPPSLGVRCFLGRGSSGGPWLIDGGAAIAGMTTYGLPGNNSSTFGPYFSHRNVGALVRGL